jgi:hypothetical protein
MHQTVENIIENQSGIKFSFIAGLIPKEDRMRFKILVFRRTRGNAMTVLHDLENPILTFDKKKVEKTLYVVIIRETDLLRSAITRICDAFGSKM